MSIIKKIINQFLKFLMVSGIGWLIDFVIFYIISGLLHCSVMISNIISTIPAFSFVFIVSTRKIFNKSNGRISIVLKYVIYFAYQIILVLTVSAIGQNIYELLIKLNLLLDESLLKLTAKILITPITICCNFIMLKLLTEKI